MHVRRWYCFVNRLAKASGLGVGIFGSVVFSSGGIASSALGLISFTLLLDRMLLRMSMVRLSRRAVGFQLSLCALKAAKYTLTLINIAFGLSDHRVHAVFWRGRI